MTEAQIEGIEDLDRQLLALIKTMDPDKVEPILLTGAKTIAKAAKTNAPLGPTGNLKKSIYAKILTRRGGVGDILGFSEGQAAPGFAGVNYRKAPHARLVEYGTRKMAARPFLRPAWDTNKEPVKRQIIDDLKSVVEKAVK